MRFAFSSGALASRDLVAHAETAKELGYDGVEVQSAALAAADAEQVKEAFAEAGVSIAAVACPAAYSGDRASDERAAGEIRRCIEAARAIGCPLVKMLDATPRRSPPEQIIPAMGIWLLPLGEHAARHDVRLAVTNAQFLRTARRLWLLTEQLHNPAVGVCWDPLPAAIAGEMPAISVPTLGGRIQAVQVRDAVLKESARLCRLGEGDVRLPDLFQRLMGIGYAGWVTVSGEVAAAAADPSEELAQSLATLKQWTAVKREAPAPAAKAKPAAAVGG